MDYSKNTAILWATDDNGNCIYMGSGWGNVTGWEFDQAKLRHWRHIVSDRAADYMTQRMGEAKAAGLSWHGEVSIRCKDGGNKLLMFQGSPHVISGKRYWLGIAYDITEISMLERGIFKNGRTDYYEETIRD